MKKFIFSLVIIAALAQTAIAQLTPSSDYAKFKPVLGQDLYRTGESFKLLFELEIQNGWHSQSNNPTLESLIPTTLKVTGEKGVSFGRVYYPPGTEEKFEFSKEPLSTYKETVYIGVTGTIPDGLDVGAHLVKAVLRVQICDDKVCLPPSDMAIDFTLPVAPKNAPIEMINADLYKSQNSLFSAASSASGGYGDINEIRDYIESRGLLITFIFIFLGGLALNLTPCVYPLIPVTISYFGGQSEKKKGMVVIHAFLYLMGMAAMYSALGVAAALTGDIFGGLLQSAPVILFIAAVLVGLSLSMFGLYDLQPPAFLAEMGGKNRKGFVGAFMMGLTVGIIAAPCIGPFVIGLLTFVGEKGDPMLGFSMFFVLALGLGTPFVFLAIFSGAITKLPSSGMWMVWVRQLFGFILLGMAIYFMEPIIPEAIFLPLAGGFAIVSGIYLGLISKVANQGAAFKTFRYGLSLVIASVGAFLIVSSTQNDERPEIVWEKATQEALESASSSSKPVIIDFTASWCLPCKELDHFTFSDERAVALSEKFVTLKADFTKSGNEEAEAMKKRFNVVGVPTVVFIGADGIEQKELRFVGFVNADEFVSKMQKLLQ
jgi:thiol:disulfide interchange protein DsbD